MRKALFLQYLNWHFFIVPKKIYQGWNNFLYFTLNYFSVEILLRTYFFPWHRYYFPYGKEWDLVKYLESLVGNITSIIIGIVFRTFLIIVGILVSIFVFLVGLLVLVGWFFLPVFLIFIFLVGFRFIF